MMQIPIQLDNGIDLLDDVKLVAYCGRRFSRYETNNYSITLVGAVVT